ncbi:hypothetical protein [Comamonas sp. A7-5]|uniref:hypothetical protein n=1 Tax=Comamonas sp. A7-5 TaxID=673549 RepID=UPI0031D6B6B9
MAKKSDTDAVAVVDGVEVLGPATPRLRIPLRSADDVRRELARLYRQMKSKEISAADGTKLAYVLNLLRQAIETGELETRIAALESQAQTLKGGK